MADSQTLAVRSSTDVTQLEELEQVLLSDNADSIAEGLDDPDAISREIEAQLLAAESDEELASFGTATGWRELLDIPVELRGFKWRRSDFAEQEGGGPPVYFIVNAREMADGQPVVLTTGSRNVLAMLINMARRGTLVGAVVKLVEAERATARGYKPLRLQLVTSAPADS